MRRLLRLEKAAGLALSVAGLVCMAGFVSPGPAVAATGPAAITDPAGDTINRDTNAKLTSAATDIVSASVDSGAAGVVLTFKTQQMGNPATDPNWASPNTFVSWQVDDNGDGKVDDTISYSADRSVPGGIVADNTHWAGNNAPAAGPSTTFTVDNTAPAAPSRSRPVLRNTRASSALHTRYRSLASWTVRASPPTRRSASPR